MTNVKLEVRGLEELQRKIERIVKDLQGTPYLKAMSKATLVVQRDARINAPVDTGRLRASITPEVRAQGATLLGVVGTNVVYAAKVEVPGPVRRSGRRPYLQPALTENADAVFRILGDAVGRITS